MGPPGKICPGRPWYPYKETLYVRFISFQKLRLQVYNTSKTNIFNIYKLKEEKEEENEEKDMWTKCTKYKHTIHTRQK